MRGSGAREKEKMSLQTLFRRLMCITFCWAANGSFDETMLAAEQAAHALEVKLTFKVILKALRDSVHLCLRVGVTSINTS